MKTCPLPTFTSVFLILQILKAFPKSFPTKMKPSEKKWGKKSEWRGEERKARTGKCSCVTLKPKHCLEILIFVDAQSSEADILHLEQRAIRGAWPTYRVLGSIGSLWPDSWLKMAQLASQGIFRYNSLKLMVNIQRGEIFIKNGNLLAG